MAAELSNQSGERTAETVEMPASTAWPIVLAFGITALFGGLVTSVAVSWLGAIVSIAGAVGWFRDVLPYEAHEFVPVVGQEAPVETRRREVAQVQLAGELKRAWLPLEIHPISSGFKGGLAGSMAMAGLAILYGVLSQGSIWYPINLLAAGFFPTSVSATTAQFDAFHLRAFVIAIPIHLITSVLVGLLYSATLPMLPRRPVLLGGFVAPILWSGLIHSVLGVVNPVLNQRIDWLWYAASQIGFGIVAGIVVSRQTRIRTWQQLPLSLRMGMEASGMTGEDRSEGE